MIVILAVVIFILWKYTHVLDGLKAKIKGQQEKWKKNATEAAQREREKEKKEREKEFEAIREKRRQEDEKKAEEAKKLEEKRAEEARELQKKRVEEARKLVEKRANCEHTCQPVHFGGGALVSDDMFNVIDKEGHSINECISCGKRIKGEVVAKINCQPIKCKHDFLPVDDSDDEVVKKFARRYGGDALSAEICYDYKGESLHAGSYRVWLDTVCYLMANRNWPKLDVSKGDICVVIQISSDSVNPNADYPVGLNLVKYLRFVDKDGVPILDDTPLSTYKIDIKKEDEIAEEKFGCEFYSLGENEQEECRREAKNSHMAMLKVPDQECELRVFAEFSDS